MGVVKEDMKKRKQRRWTRIYWRPLKGTAQRRRLQLKYCNSLVVSSNQ